MGKSSNRKNFFCYLEKIKKALEYHEKDGKQENMESEPSAKVFVFITSLSFSSMPASQNGNR